MVKTEKAEAIERGGVKKRNIDRWVYKETYDGTYIYWSVAIPYDSNR